MRSSDRNIVKEAIADARQVKKLAEEAAKQKLVEEMTPKIKNLVEKTIRDSIEKDEGANRMRQKDSGYGGITDFEEGKDLDDDEVNEMSKDDKKDDKDLEKESLDAMFPGMQEDDEEGELDMGMEGLDSMAPEEELPEMAFGEEQPEEEAYQYERRIPTLGEGECGDDEEVDEEISIDEDGLKKAYEEVMKTAKAIGEASVTSGFADTEQKSSWDTEDSMPTDRGLEDKESDKVWDEARPKASQDYQVKEAITKGLKENRELARYVSYLEEQHANAMSVIKGLTRQIKEVNLFNRKVLHVNEILNDFGKNLTNEQKKLVISKIDEAITVREAKIVSEALKASFKSALNLNEGRVRKSGNKPNAQRRVTSGAPNQKVLRESVDKSGMRDQFARQRELAGIVS